ncbi:MAG: DUF4435 domain-containing protein [Helicobacteraceae bacterium]|jgi:ABC-type cobalamin/Fe3+-siderophores transport system ATPase subunit|nr:DUF4435 domain-containing protein [Helicobacteraceae bacterium]
MEYKYKLPNENRQVVEYPTNNNSLIIIGANGSGKSKLGAWMEEEDKENIHRVGAQRSLNFGEYIQLKSYEQAENLLLYGYEYVDKYKGGRWNWGGNQQTTMLLQDYEYVLSALIAKKNNQNDAFIEDCKKKEAQNQSHDNVPDTVLDTLKRIWGNVFPQRDIDFADSKVTAILKKSDGVDVPYKGNEMSDGERVGLYLIAQCLCVPENKTVIIDEPEIHLHRSIMNRLWTEIEKERKDCFFIYITHDTQFAANHKDTDKIWVKSFDGTNWILEKMDKQENGLPEQLLLDIMGNRKKVLFIEGTADSYDSKLYSEIYKDYYIVPCGGCSSVITRTKAMKNTPQLHDLECYGIIDKDYRNEHEINELKKDNIFTVNVAEVENLFLVEELLCVVNKILYPSDNGRIDKIKNAIIDERYKKQRTSQICEAVVSELKHKLSLIEIQNNDEEHAKQSLEDAYKNISYDGIKTEVEQKFANYNDYKQILAVFNCKSLSCEAEKIFGLKKDEYKKFVIGQLYGDKAQDIIEAIILYLPTEIKR